MNPQAVNPGGDTREKLPICDLPKVLKGHWDTVGGREMAQCYAGKTRADLCHGEMSDLAVANAVYMADRYDLDLITWQTAAKERIRWLSVQLALSRARNGGQP